MAVNRSESQIQDLLIHLFGPLSIESVQVAVCFTRKIISSFYRGRETYSKMVRKSSLEKGTEPSNRGPMSSTLAMGWIFFFYGSTTQLLYRYDGSLVNSLCFAVEDEAIPEVTGEARGRSFWTITDLIVLSIC